MDFWPRWAAGGSAELVEVVCGQGSAVESRGLPAGRASPAQQCTNRSPPEMLHADLRGVVRASKTTKTPLSQAGSPRWCLLPLPPLPPPAACMQGMQGATGFCHTQERHMMGGHQVCREQCIAARRSVHAALTHQTPRRVCRRGAAFWVLFEERVPPVLPVLSLQGLAALPDRPQPPMLHASLETNHQLFSAFKVSGVVADPVGCASKFTHHGAFAGSMNGH